ncbi:MAG: hypothetical protein KC414_05930, partial [Romboutsia sp.]|nr:hypothetical protein [Romboutsia sp.]
MLSNLKIFLNASNRNKLTVILDIIFIPIMYLLGGFKKDALQWSHKWNIQKHFNHKNVDESLGLNIKGSDTSKYYT